MKVEAMPGPRPKRNALSAAAMRKKTILELLPCYGVEVPTREKEDGRQPHGRGIRRERLLKDGPAAYRRAGVKSGGR